MFTSHLTDFAEKQVGFWDSHAEYVMVMSWDQNAGQSLQYKDR
jgi:hypothetical protein